MTDSTLPKFSFGISLLFVAVGFMAVAEPSSMGQAAATAPTTSSSTTAPYVPTMTFDVASVRENKDVIDPA